MKGFDKSRWKKVSFGKLVRKVNDKVSPASSGLERFIAGEHIQSNDFKITSWGIIGKDVMGPAFHMRFKQCHVLFVSRRPYLRKVGVPDFEGICANTTFIIEPASDDLHKDFLPFLMQSESFVEHTVSKQRGSVNPYVNFKDLAIFQFLLPPWTSKSSWQIRYTSSKMP